MNATTYTALVLLLGACAGDGGPPKAAPVNPPITQPVSPSPGSAMTQPPAPQTPPTTTAEQVKRWAPAGSSVVDVRARGEADLDLAPGVDVFMVTPQGGPPIPDRETSFSVVAVVGGVGSPILEDKAAILAAVAKTTKDPQKLARVGLLLNGRDDSPLASPENDQQKKAGVKAPAIAGNAIDFWTFSGAPSRNLYHYSLDLSTAALTTSTSVGGATAGSSGVIASAKSAIDSGNPAAFQQALDAVAAACASDHAAKKFLFDTLASHAREDVRAAAAYSAPKCGHDALGPLITSLEHDKSRIVRGKAAFAIAEIGDKKAIPALEKATTTDIAGAANIALDQLKKK
ncbi:MAG TPA: HEAT repeat domain-containing protein [Kofleriaceae bacterium]|nr:HEAT repeat domain-containing protein [Kofleriaceae bacterium]